MSNLQKKKIYNTETFGPETVNVILELDLNQEGEDTSYYKELGISLDPSFDLEQIELDLYSPKAAKYQDGRIDLSHIEPCERSQALEIACQYISESIHTDYGINLIVSERDNVPLVSEYFNNRPWVLVKCSSKNVASHYLKEYDEERITHLFPITRKFSTVLYQAQKDNSKYQVSNATKPYLDKSMLTNNQTSLNLKTNKPN